jgi:putative long chain acyl-CoA synthase
MLARTLVNGLEVARFGGLRTTEQPAPHDVVVRKPTYRLRRYFPDGEPGGRPSVLLVPPLMLAADVWDVSERSSAVTLLHQQGIDPWVVDFGDPGQEPDGMRRNVTDHVLAVEDALERVRAMTGRDVHLAGYSQGGLFCYQVAALRQSEGILSIVGLGSPLLPASLPLPEEAARWVSNATSAVLGYTGVPGWLLRRMFKFANPPRAIKTEWAFLRALHDREALLPRERQRQFLTGEGWVNWSGPAIAEIAQIMSGNRYSRGGLVFEDRAASLSDITCPVLIFVGESDEYGPPESVRAIANAAPRADVYENVAPVGHFGLGVGSHANRVTWPTVARWVRWREEHGEPPEGISLVDPAALTNGDEAASSLQDRVTYGAGLVAQTSVGAVRAGVDVARQTAASALDIGSDVLQQLPKLIRLERIRPNTRISYSLILEERVRTSADSVCFLFKDRAYTHADVKRRVDNVARGLMAVGTRRGERVGVLMDTRPSALTVVAALSRIGAVCAMLRPDGPEGSVAREAALSGISRIVTDPERSAAAAEANVPVLVLGGGGGPRDLGPDVIDMEQIDPHAVEIPAWYRPDPGRARDIAFILFVGSGDNVTAVPITNRRWALSAFGAASTAALTSADTVYGVAPLYHSSGLLLATAAAVGGNARLAMANTFDPATFWDEVRRYGVTIVPYTWAMLDRLIHAAPAPGERNHPVRLFVGSGMPPALWRAVTERFAPAHVVEFYAATQANAILANVSGEKVGSMGRPLPGSARLRIAEYDISAHKLKIGRDGYARSCAAESPGILLIAVDPDDPPLSQEVLRGVFKPDDAWIATGDIFSRDADGDYWYIGPAAQMFICADEMVAPRAIEDALNELDEVRLAAYFTAPGEPGDAGAHVALALREGAEKPSTDDIRQALAGLAVEPEQLLLHFMDEMPMTPSFRPDPAAGVASPAPGTRRKRASAPVG